LGIGLKALGHTVYFMGNRFDGDILRPIAAGVIEVPSSPRYIDQNDFTTEWLRENWKKYFDEDTRPDIVVVGGWPFIGAIPFFKEKCGKVVYSDHGVVPLDSYSGEQLEVLNKLRSLKRQYLKESAAIVAVSDFIMRTQSIPYAGPDTETRYILNGADHMEMNIWPADGVRTGSGAPWSKKKIAKLMAVRKKMILLLGRWEPGCYKNVEAAYEIMAKIRKEAPDCVLLVLGDDISIRPGYEDTIIPIGFPDDRELQDIMRRVEMGISLSRWEGFNLPIAEMQWLDRPVLAFNIGAHPEVIAHPWCLCEDNAEIISKSLQILSGGGLDAKTREQCSTRFHQYFTWDRAIGQYNDLFLSLLNPVETKGQQPILLIMDITNASRDPANSGVIRVTRRLGRELQKHIDPIFAIWDDATGEYVLPTADELGVLGRFNGPMTPAIERTSADGRRITLDSYLRTAGSRPGWLLFTETVPESRGRAARKYARDNGIRCAAIFYDAIPVMYPELCKDKAIRDNHRDYMAGLAECDIVIPISKFSADCLRRFWDENRIEGSRISPVLLPGEFGGYGRSTQQPPEFREKASILCVSTLEPRKNHRKLIEACMAMQADHPELEWSLNLVGNRSAGSEDIAEYVESASSSNPRIKWMGIVDDDTLHQLYNEADFTVYPSVVEGFGMPIIESLWHGKPCLCSREGVMAELARDGGCLTTDVSDVKALSGSIYRMATDRELLAGLAGHAAHRPMRTWEDYTTEFLDLLRSPVSPTGDPQYARVIDRLLYPDCRCGEWRMSDSERLGLTAILQRLRPTCSIVVGTRNGGSLSLIAQFSSMTFSIDIDPDISQRLKCMSSVAFLTGPSASLLPILLDELATNGVGVDFILIDGDHSCEGIKGDLKNILAYVPPRPLVIVIHDSFNPECRRGMLETDWERSPYVHFVDIDFIPGALIGDNGSFGSGSSGGLALAYLKAETRNRPLEIKCSAGGTYAGMKTALRG